MRTEKAFGYIRCRHVEDSSYEQFEKILEFAEQNGYEIEEWYIDRCNGEDRENRALYNISPGQTVLMVGPDRISRNFPTYFSMMEKLKAKDIRVVFTNKSVITI